MTWFKSWSGLLIDNLPRLMNPTLDLIRVKYRLVQMVPNYSQLQFSNQNKYIKPEKRMYIIPKHKLTWSKAQRGTVKPKEELQYPNLMIMSLKILDLMSLWKI